VTAHIDPNRTFEGGNLRQLLPDLSGGSRYFVIMRFGGVLDVGGAGEMRNVTHVFQP
jgi:hypothetical protein